MKRLFALMAVLALICSPACKPDEVIDNPADNTTLEVAKVQMDFPQEEGQQTVIVTTNASTWEARADKPWCHLQPKGTQLVVSVDASDERLVRECTVTVTAGSLSKDFRVRQLGYDAAILMEMGAFEFTPVGGQIELVVTANVALESSISQDWIQAEPETKAPEMVTTHYYFKVLTHVGEAKRDGTITFTEKLPEGASEDFRPQSAVARITQLGLDRYRPGPTESLPEDIKLTIVSATTSSQQNGSGAVEQAFDGKMNTIWHSNWSNGGDNYFPITVTFNLDESRTVDYFIYYPRTDGHNNGNFKEVTLEVSENGADFTYLMDINFRGSGTPTKVLFDAPVKAKSFRYTVHSGAGDGQGFASCAEMEYYAKDPAAFDYTTLFADPTCSELKAGVTQEDILSCEHPFFKNLALYLIAGKYNMEFRVAEFKAYPHPDIQARTHKTNAYSLFDNPTGISVKEGDELMVLAGDTHGNPIGLFVQNLDKPEGNGFRSGSSYSLSKGVNRLKMANKGLVYVMYHSSTLEEATQWEPVKLHFASGTVNGYFNAQDPAHQGRWEELLQGASDKYFDLVGKYSHATFETEDFRKYTANSGPQLAAAFDTIVLSQQQLMGLEKYNKMYRNRSYLNVMYNSYMNATSYRTSYVKGTMNTLCDAKSVLSDGIWGPSHEIGHCNQTSKGVLWVGCTEVTNNIMSQYLQTTICHQNSRVQTENMGNEFRNRYSKGWNQIVVRKLPHVNGSDDVFARLIPFWQLELYFGNVLGMTPLQRDDRGGFYPDVYEYARTAPVYNGISDGDAQLEFVYAASLAAKTNLLDFFEKWGFLTPVDLLVEDYSKRQLTVTQEAADEIRRRVEALGFPKPELAIEFISDNTVEVYKHRLEVEPSANPADAFYQDGRYTIKNWKNVVVYQLEDAQGEILYIGSGENTAATTDWFDFSGRAYDPSFKLYAISCTGQKTLIPLQ